jgi:hypothetical protein
MKAEYVPYFKRLMVILVAAMAFVLIVNEVFFLLQKDKNDRAPQTMQLVIPEGTSELVKKGHAAPTIPEEMVFVVGDVLEVVNEDSVDHQLGPIWVPPGTTGSLMLEDANKYAYSCSFAPSRYLGIDVREATTIGTRLVALFFATPPMAIFLFIYSLLVFPIKQNKKVVLEEQQA